jgi:hypothetical protein
MRPDRAPTWARKRQSHQDSSKAARIAALYLLRDELAATPKMQIAAAREAVPALLAGMETLRAVLNAIHALDENAA